MTNHLYCCIHLINYRHFRVGRPGWFWDHYSETPEMSTYLLAFMITDLQQEITSDPLIKLWSRLNFINYTKYAAEISPRILHYFEDFFVLKYPLKKIDFVAVPELVVGAMENWGLITLR